VLWNIYTTFRLNSSFLSTEMLLRSRNMLSISIVREGFQCTFLSFILGGNLHDQWLLVWTCSIRLSWSCLTLLKREANHALPCRMWRVKLKQSSSSWKTVWSQEFSSLPRKSTGYTIKICIIWAYRAHPIVGSSKTSLQT
jgi:hypothetical protein